MTPSKDIDKILIQGSTSIFLAIPKKVALEYGLTDDSHVILEGTADGILIRKLNI